MRDPSGRPRGRAAASAATLDALRRIVRALRLANSGVEKSTGLSAAQLFVLEQVAAAPGASLSELAQRTLTDRTSVAAVVDRLASRGLVERRRSDVDRRRVEILPTESGRGTLEHAPHPPTRRVLMALETLDDRQLQRLAVSLTRLVRSMGLSDEPSVMLFEEDGASHDATHADAEGAAD
ncbi:regulatory protein MarR [Gemmatirosa kalamazoonensis]|uniref:Regulatory protein MarR n=1 Tax=Gemmatirosa kalamazoonensis TaxID=861299 RepID=W0RIU8_9BACT|nr:MarR family transcriptional regulator [Gemmatirosa kalamazoonensis]AHG89333.1 regulatory protein MarR [Gemmatirosa kalamazoonensis]